MRLTWRVDEVQQVVGAFVFIHQRRCLRLAAGHGQQGLGFEGLRVCISCLAWPMRMLRYPPNS